MSYCITYMVTTSKGSYCPILYVQSAAEFKERVVLWQVSLKFGLCVALVTSQMPSSVRKRKHLSSWLLLSNIMSRTSFSHIDHSHAI